MTNTGTAPQICFTRVSSPLGWIILASNDLGLCVVQFCGLERPSETCMRTQLHKARPQAELHADAAPLRKALKALRCYFQQHCPLPSLPLDLSQGTAFQQKVWGALCTIPFGETRTYGDIASMIGQPRAARAVGQACGLNPLAIVVPCHRVTARNDKLGGYSGGVHIKQALLAHEEQALV